MGRFDAPAGPYVVQPWLHPTAVEYSLEYWEENVPKGGNS